MLLTRAIADTLGALPKSPLPLALPPFLKPAVSPPCVLVKASTNFAKNGRRILIHYNNETGNV